VYAKMGRGVRKDKRMCFVCVEKRFIKFYEKEGAGNWIKT